MIQRDVSDRNEVNDEECNEVESDRLNANPSCLDRAAQFEGPASWHNWPHRYAASLYASAQSLYSVTPEKNGSRASILFARRLRLFALAVLR